MPLFSFLKLNVDGSSFGNPGPSGGGFIVRDASGDIVLTKSVLLATIVRVFLLNLMLFCLA